MNRKALFVDDDVNLLDSFRRQLRKKADLTIAEGAKAGIEAAARQGPFAVVISDYNMPGMNGVDMLRVIRHGSPDTVRVLLTGHADLEIAIQAVNEGNIFRLLTKPCPPETIEKVLDDAFRHHDLITAERELLEKTLTGSVAVLCDLISLVKPDVFGRVSRILPYLRGVSKRVADPRAWETETAAMLSVVGFITLPDSLINKVEKGRPLTDAEMAQFLGHPAFGARLVAKIPRMDRVADIVAYQEKHFEGGGVPKDDMKGEQIPLGARILKAVVDFDILLANGMQKGEAMLKLERRKGVYDPAVLAALNQVISEQARYTLQKVHLIGLAPGMIMAEDLYGQRGTETILLVAKGRELNETVIEFLIDNARTIKINQPVAVIQPMP
ncbi:MAG TPA: HD domain-containing phosphohydrolase [Humidesulfovibrio sp.]|uniref:HD domain-containing phosphohydrolase n=1 Tax=Humidesulfovibrio sp. TaxID=2910988 RepID=UPI002CBED6A5|nr:HD domain-containing phosphohydrolase [Humidesulfovibrio sp.]HWR03770.1 HD domain-containing phosphohydrolase [Humidesulfovibrio sp.]